ncbi:MAG: aminodeoxychorismate/anthranilate synthase component II [Lachnospiraceae bacterium]|jgi:anthranilate synthase component 2|nr:aminodeoxychorismate/anthranilate synthase component II [Lachnospiraceae bacterium]MCH4030154.1 aminodeoxychorismate/anthranilate synthase component II [Lachnospiraceae bacterium]MCH4070192.1 aminodeoxychorismate/anthranilate synthase component II [Lachnospiraceae bacterium]MCH4107698.1 aminodeoxychorismate/anthranilate synthase component II [Lachnospiraceae bacterium]MCI1301451.1 aminodeoxychorismate/anthranilate synthase component II [Lachnospiraceae bacterium]
MLLLIDNYDSFSYNLYQMIGEMCPDIRVIRNDAMSVEQIRDLSPSGIILSPGPGRPVDAGVCEDVVKTLSADIPILGVCLGEQAIVEAFGGVVTYAKHLMHGKQSKTKLDLTCPVFRGLPEVTEVARYHSLAAEEKSLPEVLKITARADDGEIMAVAHRQYPVFGLQFHPESIMTPEGKAMLKNFLDITA